jgi:TolB protein
MTIRRLLSAALVLGAVLGGPAAAQDPQRGVFLTLEYDPRSMPGIAVIPMTGAFGDSVRAIIHRDLDLANRFTMIQLQGNDPTPFRNPAPRGGLNYGILGQLGARYAIEMQVVGPSLHLVLHDVTRSQVARVDDFALPEVALGRDWRMALHRAADRVHEWVTGTPGIAATRIAYMRGSVMRIVDFDGAGEVTVPTDENAISPAWHPNGTTIVYSTYGAESRVVVADLVTGRSRTLAGPARNTSYVAPVFSGNGTSVTFALATERGADLFTVPASGGAPSRLSVGRGTDNLHASYDPTGRRLAFTTNRSGNPEVYIMDADGSNASMLLPWPDVGDRSYRAEPDWSPDGQKVVLQSRINGEFQVVMVTLSDRRSRVLTSEGINEQPSWAPDSRHVVFTSSRTGSRQLWILDTETGRTRQLTRSPGSKLAAWSPRLVSLTPTQDRP